MSNRSNETEERKSRQIRIAIWSVVVVVIAVGFIILAKYATKSNSSSTTTSESSPVPAELLAKVTGLKDDLFAAVGIGSVADSALPKTISAPALTQNSKPQVLYIGGEYCPYCATERWPMVIALSRFGTFTNLLISHSSTTDTYPNTQTFSFHGATYTSNYLSFTGIETTSNVVSGNSYAPLDKLTADQQKLLDTYDAAPYVPAADAGSIPFIDFGGKYLISGATYSPTVLQGKTHDEIADALSDKSTDISKGAIGAANVITATLCNLTGNMPADVCTTDTIKSIQAKIGS